MNGSQCQTISGNARLKRKMEISLKLFEAIERDEVEEALRILSENSSGGIILECLGPLRVSALQIAAWKGQTTSLLDLLYQSGAKVNGADKLGRCALHYATQRGNIHIVKWLLRNGAHVHTKFAPSFCTKDASLKERMLDEHSYSSLGSSLPLPDSWGRTSLHLSVKYNHPEICRLLIQAGADPNVTDDQEVTPILLAGSNIPINDLQELSKYAKIIQILVSAGANVNQIHKNSGITALHQACILRSAASVKVLLDAGSNPLHECYNTGSTPLHEAAAAGCIEILRVLLPAIPPDSVNVRDKLGRTPLIRAAYQGHRECVILLIDSGGNLSAKTKTGITSIDAIFTYTAQPLSLLERVFDNRIRFTPCSSTDKDNYMSVDCSVLTPETYLQMSVISAMINAASKFEHLSLLRHPLLELFLKLKWNQLRIFFIVLVLVHVCFAISVSTYSTVLFNDPTYYYLSRKVLLFSSSILLFHNVMQLLMVPRYYVKQLEIWLSFVCSITSLLIVLMGNDCYNHECRAPKWKLHCISIVILLSWTHLMLLIGRFPTCGYYALMFYTVFKNLLKVLLAFIWLIVGFALSFSVLFYENDQFQNPWKALAKTVVMMMGEYEYANMFTSHINEDSFLLVTSRFVFLAFVILASIVLMNLMIGLAVSDIRLLEQVGHVQTLLKQAEFVAHLERVTDHRIFRNKWIHKTFQNFIESKRKISTKLIVGVAGNLPSGNVVISSRIVERLIEIAKRNKGNRDETDAMIEEDGRANFKRAIQNIKKQLEVIEKIKHKDNDFLNEQSTNFCIKRKLSVNALNM